MDLSSGFEVAISHGHYAIERLALAEKLNRSNMNTDIEQAYNRKIEFKHLTAAIFLFQGMLEAIINHAIETNEKLIGINGSFKNKWKNSLNTLGENTKNFSSYHEDIYKKYRNPLVHPKAKDIQTLNNISFDEVYSGIKSGWLAFDELNNGLGTPSDDDSWGILCRTNNLRETL